MLLGFSATSYIANVSLKSFDADRDRVAWWTLRSVGFYQPAVAGVSVLGPTSATNLPSADQASDEGREYEKPAGV